jgi:hypothetical protein
MDRRAGAFCFALLDVPLGTLMAEGLNCRGVPAGLRRPRLGTFDHVDHILSTEDDTAQGAVERHAPHVGLVGGGFATNFLIRYET